MSRHLLQRFAVWTAFAVALLFPLTAGAAILPLCEVDAVTMAPRAPAALPLAFAAAEDPATPCDELSLADSEDDEVVVDSKIAAFCDARGASAIAPQRVHGINDARIEATPSCARLDAAAQTIAPSSPEGYAAGPAGALLDPAALSAATLIPPAPSELLPAYAPVTDAERSGIEQAVYHPPR